MLAAEISALRACLMLLQDPNEGSFAGEGEILR